MNQSNIPTLLLLLTASSLIVTKFIKGDTQQDAIEACDTVLTKCMTEKAHGTTLGMIDCYLSAMQHKLNEVDSLEQKIFKALLKNDSARFVTDTTAWHSYFRIESTFLFKTFYTWANYQKYGNLGREACIDQAEWKYRLAKQRFKNLTDYYETIAN